MRGCGLQSEGTLLPGLIRAFAHRCCGQHLVQSVGVRAQTATVAFLLILTPNTYNLFTKPGRQDLIGASYALLQNGTLDPTPGYWVAVLAKRLLGTGAYFPQCLYPNVMGSCFHHSCRDRSGRIERGVCPEHANVSSPVACFTVSAAKCLVRLQRKVRPQRGQECRNSINSFTRSSHTPFS